MTGDLDPDTTQCYRWVVVPQFDADGLLPMGIHRTTWDEVAATFRNTPWRRRPLGGVEMAIDGLRRAGCLTVYIDGSFVTDKNVPNDFDACWGEGGTGTSGPGAAAVRCRLGGPIPTIDRTVFELWLGGL